jgi:plasmid stabilization system protein ParE
LTPVRIAQAEDDILPIASFIAQDSVPRALQFIDNMRDRCAKLAIFATRGRRRPESGLHDRVRSASRTLPGTRLQRNPPAPRARGRAEEPRYRGFTHR